MKLAQKEKDGQVVLELTQALASNLDIRGILFTVVQRIAEVAKVDRVSIVLVREPGRGRLRRCRLGRRAPPRPAHRLTKYPEIQQVLSSGEPLVIPTSRPTRSSRSCATTRALAFNSLAILPIVYEGRPMGVLFLRARHTFAFGEHELSLCKTVSNAMAIALRNARVCSRSATRRKRSPSRASRRSGAIEDLQRYADFFESAADGIVVIDHESHASSSRTRRRARSPGTPRRSSAASLQEMSSSPAEASAARTPRRVRQGQVPAGRRHPRSQEGRRGHHAEQQLQLGPPRGRGHPLLVPRRHEPSAPSPPSSSRRRISSSASSTRPWTGSSART
jgi:hypothetical protein